MRNRFRTSAMLAAIALAAAVPASTPGQAQDYGACSPNCRLQKTIGEITTTVPVPSLFVLNSDGVRLEGDKLTLTGVSSNTIMFADRPIRAAGHETIKQFLTQWDEGKGSFAIDPPNATISVLGSGAGDPVIDAVVTLKSPKLEGANLTFVVAVLEGNLDGAVGPAALFLDRGGGGGHGGGGGGFHGGGGGGFHGAHADYGAGHGAWYRGHPYQDRYGGDSYWDTPFWDTPRCGYYPYPPCY
jgi:hypothetical protein